MTYPNIAAPYGLVGINLVGGRSFPGSTRMAPIQYGSPANIFNGDFIKVASVGATSGAGLVTRAAVTNGSTKNQYTGIFTGCSYTSPITKQKLFSQWWPAGMLAGDGVAYMLDDSDIIFKAAVCSSGVTMASCGWGSIGSNVSMINNVNTASSLVNGNSTNAVLAGSETTAVAPMRVIGLVEETAIPVIMTGSSATTTITLTTPGGLPRALPIGTDVAYVASNGMIIRTGSLVSAAAAAAATTVTINTATASAGVATPIPSGSTIIFTIYPEVLVKMNATVNGYTSDTAV
jgi:hypothetical protein